MSSDIDNNLSSSGNLSSSIILKEEFDEASEPTPEGKKLVLGENFMNEVRTLWMGKSIQLDWSIFPHWMGV